MIRNILLSNTGANLFSGMQMINSHLVTTGTGDTIGHPTSASLGITNAGSGATYGINTTAGAANTIQNNMIANIAATGTGTGVQLFGIRDNATGSILHNISSNTISDLSTNSTKNLNALLKSNTSSAAPDADVNGALVGIEIGPNTTTSTGTTVFNNTIRNLKANSTSTSANVAVIGISIDGANNGSTHNCTKNKIYGLENTTNVTASPFGSIMGIRAQEKRFNFANNMIALSNGSNTNNLWVYGIGVGSVNAASATTNIYYNSISISGSNSGSAANSGALCVYTTIVSTSVVTTRNNIFTNTRTGGAGNFAIEITVAPAAITNYTGNGNDLFNLTPAALCRYSSVNRDLAAWKALNSGWDNTNTTTVKPFFTDSANGDLHLITDLNCGLNNVGFTLASPPAYATDDIDATTRSTSVQPDPGADFFVPTVNADTAVLSQNDFCGGTVPSLTVTVPGSTNTANVVFKWQRDPNTGTFADIDGTIDGGIYSNFATATLTITGAAYAQNNYKYRCVLTNCSGVVSANSLPDTLRLFANPTITASNTGDYCSGQTISLFSSPSGGSTPYGYSWDGPSSYTASGQNPTRGTSTTAMDGTYDVTVTDNNGCTATASTTVVVNDCDFTWTGATSTLWTEPTNWSPNSLAGGPNGCNIDVTIPGSLSVYPQLNQGKQVGNLTMGDGSNIGIGAAGGLNICGNVQGSFTTALLRGQGRVELNGTTDQVISRIVTFNQLHINKPSGLTTVNGNTKIDSILLLKDGDIDITGTLTLRSRATHTAFLDNFTNPTAGTFTGNLTVERYNSGTGSGGYNGADFHYLSSPVVSDFADWSEIYSNFATTGSGPIKPLANCNPDSIDYTSSYGTVMEWIENAAFPTNCSQEGWSVIPQSAAAIGVGKGYTTYLQPAQTVTVVGAPNTGNQPVTLTKSSKTTVREPGTGTYITPGGNLVGNPFPSPYEWDRFGGNAHIGVTAYAWVTSGGYKGTYQNINVGSNIAIGQGFMVLTDSAGTYSFQQNKRKAVANPTFYKNQNGASLTVEVAGNNFQDKTEVAFNDQATTAFDLDFDGYKMMSKSAQPTLFTGLSSVKKLSLNTQPSIAQAPTVPMGMYVGTNGNFTFTFDNIASFDPTTYIFLEDKQTSTMQDMRANNSYNFVGSRADAVDRFVIHFTPPMDVTTTDASCTTTGTIKLEQPGTASWTYTLKDQTSNVVSTGTINSTTPANIQAANGLYTLDLVDAAGYKVSQNIQVNGVNAITAAFSNSSSNVHTNEAINFNNTTSGASTYSWDFGDGSNQSTTATTTHSYAATGTYTVTLTVTNAAGCQSSVTRSVTVSNATGITDLNASSMNIFSFDDKVVVDFSKMKNVEATIQIYNLIGQELSSEKHVGSSIYTKELNEVDAAYVLVRVRNSNGQMVTKKVFISNSK